jgi:hypothetical protein
VARRSKVAKWGRARTPRTGPPGKVPDRYPSEFERVVGLADRAERPVYVETRGTSITGTAASATVAAHGACPPRVELPRPAQRDQVHLSVAETSTTWSPAIPLRSSSRTPGWSQTGRETPSPIPSGMRGLVPKPGHRRPVENVQHDDVHPRAANSSTVSATAPAASAVPSNGTSTRLSTCCGSGTGGTTIRAWSRAVPPAATALVRVHHGRERLAPCPPRPSPGGTVRRPAPRRSHARGRPGGHAHATSATAVASPVTNGPDSPTCGRQHIGHAVASFPLSARRQACPGRVLFPGRPSAPAAGRRCGPPPGLAAAPNGLLV